MARLPRLDLPGIPQHIVQRGNERQACFADAADDLRYRHALGEAALRYDCALHGFALMTNPVHLLTTPREPGGVSRMMQAMMMQAIARRYVGSVNARYRRTGTLWEGRFKSALLESERYALACYRYIELNPVRAGIVTPPREYRWSSHARNAYGRHEPRITPHAAYLSLGADDVTRLAWPPVRQHGHRALMRCACIRSSRSLGAVSGSVGTSKRWLSGPWKSDHAAGPDLTWGNEPDPFLPGAVEDGAQDLGGNSRMK